MSVSLCMSALLMCLLNEASAQQRLSSARQEEATYTVGLSRGLGDEDGGEWGEGGDDGGGDVESWKIKKGNVVINDWIF